jgi:hypothetical protein
MVTTGIFPFKENFHGRAGNRTRDLMISNQRLFSLNYKKWNILCDDSSYSTKDTPSSEERIMIGAKPRNSSTGMFMTLQILRLPCQYIFPLVNFLVNNREKFHTNSAVHSINTWNKHHNLHRLTAKPSSFQIITYNAGIKILFILLCKLRILKNEKTQFKSGPIIPLTKLQCSKMTHRQIIRCI